MTETTDLIAIAGCSCSGKSTLARFVARKLGAEIVPVDAYYRDLSHLEPEQRASTNFDSPDAIEDSLLIEDVRRLARGRAIERPVYDYTTHTRTKLREHVSGSGVVILEGLFALHWEQIRALCSTRVYVDLDEATCLNRRLERDVRERGRTPESVRHQFIETVRPMAHRHVIPSRQWADVVASGCRPVEEGAAAVLRHLDSRL